jgi:HPt (histidine-containing phosphotransfer) domain-containing protein
MARMFTDAEPVYSTLGVDPELNEIVEMFVAEMPERVGELREQLDASDWEGLRHTAHQLKGAAGSYGFNPVTPLAARVEDSILAKEPETQIRRAVEELTHLCNRLRAGAPG